MAPKQGEKRRDGDGEWPSQQSGLLNMSVGMRQVWDQGKSDQWVGIMSVTATKVGHHPAISRQAHRGEARPRSGSWHDGQMDREKIHAVDQNTDILQGFVISQSFISSIGTVLLPATWPNAMLLFFSLTVSIFLNTYKFQLTLRTSSVRMPMHTVRL